MVKNNKVQSKNQNKNQNKKQKGGDGYVVNVNEAIGGTPAFSRYSNNYRPIFDGELLQKGGDGYSFEPNVDIDGMPGIKRYTYNDTPIFKGSLLNGGYKFLKMQSGGGGDCGCNGVKKNDVDIFDLIKMNGGVKDNERKQFYAIKEVATLLTPLSTKSLLSINSKIFLNNLSEKKKQKYKQLGGYTNQIESILAPLGKNNLLVLASLLLLHYFAVESRKKEIKSKSLKGGNPLNSSLSQILAPLGVNALGTSLLLILLQKSFVKGKENNSKNSKSKILYGGNPLKNLIAPLGTNAFIATGLLILLERLFINKINESKTKDKEKKVLIGGRANKKYEKLFNMLAPITFNVFAKESFLVNYAKNLKNNSKK